MENVLEFKGEKYYNQAAGGVYRTEDGKKVFYINQNGKPVWLSSDSPIHIELREHVMMNEIKMSKVLNKGEM